MLEHWLFRASYDDDAVRILRLSIGLSVGPFSAFCSVCWLCVYNKLIRLAYVNSCWMVKIIAGLTGRQCCRQFSEQNQQHENDQLRMSLPLDRPVGQVCLVGD